MRNSTTARPLSKNMRAFTEKEVGNDKFGVVSHEPRQQPSRLGGMFLGHEGLYGDACIQREPPCVLLTAHGLRAQVLPNRSTSREA